MTEATSPVSTATEERFLTVGLGTAVAHACRYALNGWRATLTEGKEDKARDAKALAAKFAKWQASL